MTMIDVGAHTPSGGTETAGAGGQGAHDLAAVQALHQLFHKAADVEDRLARAEGEGDVTGEDAVGLTPEMLANATGAGAMKIKANMRSNAIAAQQQQAAAAQQQVQARQQDGRQQRDRRIRALTIAEIEEFARHRYGWAPQQTRQVMNNAAQTLAHVPNAGTTGATVYLPLAEARRHNIPNHVHGVGPEIGED